MTSEAGISVPNRDQRTNDVGEQRMGSPGWRGRLHALRRALWVPDDGAQPDLPLHAHPASSWRRQVLQFVGIVALYAALTAVMTYPQVTVLDRAVSAEFGDPLFSTWRLSWVAHQLPRDPLRLFDTNIFHPEQDTLAYSDSMLVPALMAAPFIWLGVHQLLVCNILLLSGFALSGAAMFLLVRSLTGQTGAALVAGFVFAFLPYRFLHYAHLELQMTQWMPLCLWALHRTVKSGRYRDGLMTGGFFALQTLSSVYYGVFFATYLVPVGLALLLGSRRAGLWPIARSLTVGAMLAAVLVSPLAKPYLAAREAVGERPFLEVLYYSASPADYLSAPRQNDTFGPLTFKWGSPERHLFQGVAVPVVAALSLWPPVSTARIGYAAGLLVALNLSRGPKGLGYWKLREYVLPYRGLRVPARVSILVGLSLSILVGYALARLNRHQTTRPARIALLGVVTALFYAEYRSTPDLTEVWRTPPPIYQALAGKPDAVLLELPLVAPELYLEPAYLYFSTFHWHRLVNGYSGFTPPSYRTLPPILLNFPDETSFAEIHRRGVDYLVVHGVFYPPARYRDIVAGLARRSDVVLERTDTNAEQQETRLYRVAK